MCSGIFPHILVQPADDVDIGALFKLHLFNALADSTECLDRQIDPTVIIIGTSVIHLLANTEPDAVSLFRELQCWCAVISF